MKKKISRQLLLMGLVGMLLMLLASVMVFYSVFSQQTRQNLRTAASVVESSYLALDGRWQEASYQDQNLRITLISPDGDAIYDSNHCQTSGNYASRPEVQQALEGRDGIHTRVSETTGELCAYYAVQMEDGMILRVSTDIESRRELFASAMPSLIACAILVLLLSIFLSILLTRRLVHPMEQMGKSRGVDDVAPYPELQPFVEAFVRERDMRLENETMRQEFTANVSHELKTPLTSISGYAELIETGIAKSEDVPEFAAKIHKEAKRLLSLVNDIIELTRLDAKEERKQSTENFEVFDLQPVLSGCVDRLGVNAQRAYVTLLFESRPTKIRGDRTMIEDMCINLCDNAIRYNRPGGKVILSCGLSEGRPYLRVKDDGIGIPEEEQERVYERFYRVDKSRSKETGGTGLGLAIVKHIAVLHQAKLELESKEGEGTDIFVYFPNPMTRTKRT